MRIHGHFHKLAKLYVSELLFSFIFCPPTFVFLQTIFFSYKAVLIMFGAISALLFIKIGLIMFGITSTLYSFIFVTEDRYCSLNQELYGMLKPSFILCRTFDSCFSCEYTKAIY